MDRFTTLSVVEYNASTDEFPWVGKEAVVT